MKKYFLPVLCWTLAISQTLAQKTLTPTVQQQLEAGSPAVKKMLHIAGFGTQVSTVAGRSNPLRLDSIKTFVGYPVSGAADSTPSVRVRYTYPTDKVEVETEANFVNGMWVPASRSTSTSDALGRVINVVAEAYDSAAADWALDSKLLVFPHGASAALIDSFQVFSWDAATSTWVFTFQSKNTYGPQDRLEKTETTFDFDGTAALIVDQFSYDANQDNTLIETFFLIGGFPLPSGKKERLYANHQLIQEIAFGNDGTGYVQSERTTYAYNAAGLVIQTNNYEWVPGVNDWNPTQIVYQEYDATARLTALETVSIQAGQPDEKIRVTYAYVADDNLALQSEYVWSQSLAAYVLEQRSYYYYAGGASAVKGLPMAQKLSLTPNPTDGFVRLALEATAEVRVFTATGQLAFSKTVQPGEPLDLTPLAPGVYEVTARSGGDFHTGKIVKQ